MRNDPRLLIYFLVISALLLSPFERYHLIVTIPFYFNLLLNKYKNPKNFGLFFLIILTLYSAFNSLFEPHFFSYNFFKDIMFFLNPIIYLHLGFLIYDYNKDLDVLKMYTLIFTFIITITALARFDFSTSIINQVTFEMRYENPISNSYSVITVALLLFSGNQLIKNRLIKFVIYFLSIIICFISFSRILLLLLVILLVFRKNIYKLRPYLFRLNLVFFLFLIFFISSSSSLTGSDNKTDLESKNMFLDKIKNSLNEIIIKDYKNNNEISKNWRGYESFLAIEKLNTSGNKFDFFRGLGLGSTVKVPMHLVKAGLNFSELNLVHNAYITILLKSGFFGILLFFLFLNKILNFKINYSFDTLTTQNLNLFSYSVIFILLSMYLTHGIYRAVPSFYVLILIGALFNSLNSISK